MLIKEVGLGLVLLFGGDSDVARRAGDALLADRIAEAVDEGGFAHIAYEGWRKAAGSASTLEFSGVEIARGSAQVDIDGAVINPFNHALLFDSGEFRADGDDRAWTFDAVELRKSGWFSQRVRLTARHLEIRGGGDAAAECSGETLVCALDATGREAIDQFTMNYTPSGTPGAVQIVFRRGEACLAAWSADEIDASELVGWGAHALAGDPAIHWSVARVRCDAELFEQTERLRPLIVEPIGAVEGVSWSTLYAGNEVLLDTLFSLVPESYAYLLE